MSRCKTTGKIKYRNQAIANYITARMWAKQPDEEIGDIHSWQCEHCGAYHIGHYSKHKDGNELRSTSPDN